VVAQSKSTSPDVAERIAAIQIGRHSYRVAAAGIICGVVLVIFTIAMHTPNKDQ